MTNGKEEYNPLISRLIFPQPASVFKFQLKTIEDLKKDAIIVLDTNVLLLPYDVGKESLDDISLIYNSLIENNRLIIPGQVTREFAKNRATKLTSMITKLRKSRDKLELIELEKSSLLESLETYQKMKKLQNETNESIIKYKGMITELTDLIKSWRWNDPVSLLYREIFSDEVLLDTSISDDELLKDLERRNLHKIPPGYEDRKKPDKGIGDVLIWHTILELGKSKDKDIIFVSNEKKGDWWHRDTSNKKETLYPRYELVDEFRRSSNGRTFHILNFSQFLKLFEARDELIEEVEQVQENEFLSYLDVFSSIGREGEIVERIPIVSSEDPKLDDLPPEVRRAVQRLFEEFSGKGKSFASTLIVEKYRNGTYSIKYFYT